MRAVLHALKVISVITLAFFSWTYLPLYQIAAFAATKEKQSPKAQGRTALQGSAEKLDKLIDDLREKAGRAEIKAARGEDAASEIESVKARKAEIDALDADLKKDFAATELKLRAANLPKEILDRHSKFVKNYEDNLSELKTNIDAIEKAKTPSALSAELTKTKKHLDTVRPAKKRKPFDPNKLPNRIVKANERQPKLKNDEWDRELKRGKAKLKAENRYDRKQILVASNGPLTGLLSGSTIPENNIQLANITFDSIIQNAAVGVYSGSFYTQPTPEDMLETPETPETHITDAIRAKAAEFNNKPVPMFNWLWNNMYFVPSYGSIQGADMCLKTMQCNATDIASLTIALFRAAGFPARYEFVTKELTIDKFMETMGGFTDPMAAINFVASGGTPVRPVISGGKITAVQFEHVYASAWIPYGNYRGLMVDNSIPIWVPLDFSLKHYVETPGIDLRTAVPFDAQTFVNQIQSTATINEAEGYVTNVNSALIQQAMQDYQTRVQTYISQNTPTATVGDVIGKRVIKQHKFPFLPATTWSNNVAGGGQSHALPDSMLSSITFNIPDPTGINNGLAYTTSLAEIAGKKITLSFSPATAADQAVIESLLPRPHADGTPIQPSELPTSLPAYLVSLKPELRIDGQVVATGSPVTMGSALSFTMALNEAGIGLSNVGNIIQAGEYYGIGLDTGGMINSDSLKLKLEATKMKLDAQNLTGLTKDDIIGDLLYTTIATYFSELDMSDEILAKTQAVIRYRAPSVGMCSTHLGVQNIFGIPSKASIGGLMMDVDRVMQAVYSKDGNMDNVKKYMLASGSMSSALEHVVPVQIYSSFDNSAQAISAVKALQIANDQGVPIYNINQGNVNAVLPQLQISEAVKSDILNAVNAGKQVTVSKTNINFNGWVGCGYIIIDPITGAGAYMISSGTNGALFLIGVALLLLAISILALPVAGPLVFVWVSLLMPIYIAFLAWLMTEASSSARDCVAAIALNILAAITIRNFLIVLIPFGPVQVLINSIRMFFGSSASQNDCLGAGLAY